MLNLKRLRLFFYLADTPKAGQTNVKNDLLYFDEESKTYIIKNMNRRVIEEEGPASDIISFLPTI